MPPIKNRIVTIPFPYDDLSAAKVRPTLCLAEPIGVHQHVVLAYITSRIPTAPLTTDLIIDELGGTGLKVASTIQLHRLITVRVTFIRRELGTLPASLEAEAANRLRVLFDL